MTPSVDMFKQLNWLPFDKRVHYLRCVMIYKACNHMTPRYITGKFTQEYDENPNYYLTSTSNLNFKLGKSQTIAWKRSFAYSGSTVWNTAPLNIKTLDTLNTFKDRCY